MKNLIRLGNKNVSVSEAPAIEVLKNAIKVNTSACMMLGAVPNKSRMDVGVDGKGAGAEVYITVISDEADQSTGRALSKNSTLNSASIKAALQQFGVSKFLITEEKSVFEGETWYRLVPDVVIEEPTDEAPASSKKVPQEVEA